MEDDGRLGWDVERSETEEFTFKFSSFLLCCVEEGGEDNAQSEDPSVFVPSAK